MTIAQRIELRRLGYTKEEINELVEQEKNPPVEQVETPVTDTDVPEQLELDLTPETPASANANDIQQQILTAVNNLTAVLQNQKLNNTAQPITQAKETAEDILNNILKG